MKVLGYHHAHSLQQFSLKEYNVEEPKLKSTDVLVRIKAISVNPIDYKIRSTRNSKEGHPVILGWDVSGVVEEVGQKCIGFEVGNEVFYAGDLLRDGGYAEFQAVDYRIIAHKPKTMSFAQAAALPLTSLTAWEALLERGFQYTAQTKVLIIGGAGGVGSAAIQILKAKTPAQVIATAARPESAEWCRKMGADSVVNHSLPLLEELQKIDVKSVDIVFATTHSSTYQRMIPDILRPFGHLCLIEDPGPWDFAGLNRKSLSVHVELMFAKTLNAYALESQGCILKEIAQLVDDGRIQTTANMCLEGISLENIQAAHQQIESGKTIGKIVLTDFFK